MNVYRKLRFAKVVIKIETYWNVNRSIINYSGVNVVLK